MDTLWKVHTDPEAFPKMSSATVVTLAQRRQAVGFTPRDLAELEGWASDDRQLTICQSDPAPFAMLYDDTAVWATWAVVREGDEVLAWDSISFRDIGRFACMRDALAALPSSRNKPSAGLPCNVVSLATYLRSRAMPAASECATP